ncbi:hypothetical protein [Mesorhizobium sp. 43Arga]
MKKFLLSNISIAQINRRYSLQSVKSQPPETHQNLFFAVLVGLVSTCLIASANYTINECSTWNPTDVIP